MKVEIITIFSALTTLDVIGHLLDAFDCFGGVTPETAWLLSEALNISPEFWANLQTTHDLARYHPTQVVKPLAALEKV